MTWTYTPPSADDNDVLVFTDDVSWVRYRLGDTTKTPQSLDDNEILFEVQQDDPKNLWAAASRCAYAMADRYRAVSGSSTSKTVGNSSLSKTHADEYNRYRELAERLARRAPGGAVAAMTGMGLVARPPAEGMFRTRAFGTDRLGTP
mgnify:CR=1 FL=1